MGDDDDDDDDVECQNGDATDKTKWLGNYAIMVMRRHLLQAKKNEYIVQGENILNSINFCPGHDCKSHKKCVSAVTALLQEPTKQTPFITQPPEWPSWPEPSHN